LVSKYNLILVCVRDKNLEIKAHEIVQKQHFKEGKVLIYGFTSNLKELLSVADFVITEAGPSGVFEIASLQKKCY